MLATASYAKALGGASEFLATGSTLDRYFALAMRFAIALLVFLAPPIAAAGQVPTASLLAGSPVHREIAAGEAHVFALALEANEFVHLTLDGEGALIRLSITEQDDLVANPSRTSASRDERRMITERERRGGVRAPIEWAHVTTRAITMLVTVESLEHPGPQRPYALALKTRRPAESSDVARAAASRAIEAAEHSEREGAAGAAQAIAHYEEAQKHWHDAGDRHGEARAILAHGRLLAEGGRTRDATQAFEQAIALCRDVADRSCEATGLHVLGRLDAVTGQLPQAEQLFEDALEIRRQIGDRAGQAETLMEIGGMELTRSENVRGEKALASAVDLARETSDRRTEADALNMGAVHQASLGNVEPGRERYEAARRIRRFIHDEVGYAQTTSNLGVLHRGLGEPRVAITYYEEALAIRRRVAGVQAIANTIHNLGVARADLSEHERALELFREALDLWRQSGGKRGEAFTLQAIGQSYARLGDAPKALEHYALCTPLWKATGDKRGEAQTLLAAASLRSAQRDHMRALDSYSMALELGREAGYKREIGLALVGQASIHRLQQDLDTALSEAREARAVLKEISERREEGRALAEIGAALFAGGHIDEASASYREALALFEGVEDRGEEASVRLRLARTAELGGDGIEASRQAVAALDLVESVRANLAAEGLSVSLFASKRPFYDDAVALLMRLHAQDPSAQHDAEAFAVSERMRARALLDLLAEQPLQPRHAANASLVSDLQRTQELINSKAARLTRLLNGASTRNGPLVATARREIDDLLARLDGVRARLRTQEPDLEGLAHPTPLTLSDVQSQMLDEHSVLLEYAIGDERSYGWVITRTTHETFTLPGRDEIERLARRAYDALAPDAEQAISESDTEKQKDRARADADFQETTRALSALLIAPAASAIRDRSRVVVVSDGVLQTFPFATLRPPGRGAERLGSTHEVVMLPSASVGAVLRARATSRPAASDKIAVFADPVFASDDTRLAGGVRSVSEASGARLPRLRFSRQEGAQIASLAPQRTTLWADFEASRQTALSETLVNYGIIHFAAHALVDDERPGLSSIVLSRVDRQGRTQNGLVRLHEVYNLSLNARLVVLSACRTALGRHVEGEGLIGLARGFLHAGADAVVATLWDVDDRATTEFMTRFYEALLQRGLSPAAALQSARRSMQHDPRWSRPEHWAAFILIGASS